MPAWISDHVPSKVCDAIYYPFRNFNRCIVDVFERINNFITLFIMDVITYPYWGFKLNRVSKRGRRAKSNVYGLWDVNITWGFTHLLATFTHAWCTYRDREGGTSGTRCAVSSVMTLASHSFTVMAALVCASGKGRV